VNLVRSTAKEVINNNQHGHSGQFWWPPLGKSHGRRWAVFMTATGQISMTVDITREFTTDGGSLRTHGSAEPFGL
jgi:hypothetical protein